MPHARLSCCYTALAICSTGKCSLELPLLKDRGGPARVRAGAIPRCARCSKRGRSRGGQVAAAGTIGAGAIGAIQDTVGPAHDALFGVEPSEPPSLQSAGDPPDDGGL